MPKQKYFDGDKSLINKRYGRLIISSAIKRIKRGKYNNAYVETTCDCSAKKVILLNSLISGETVSCGCFMRERQRESQITHGHSSNGVRTKAYKIWSGVLRRCNNPKNKSYVDYGGRGIKVCEAWLKFENFLADMGNPKENESIERKDNDGNYEPDNCIWATRKIQNRNSRHNHMVEYEGDSKCVAEWAEILGISAAALRSRLERGWTVKEAFGIPTLRKGQGNLRIKERISTRHISLV